MPEKLLISKSINRLLINDVLTDTDIQEQSSRATLFVKTQQQHFFLIWPQQTVRQQVSSEIVRRTFEGEYNVLFVIVYHSRE